MLNYVVVFCILYFVPADDFVPLHLHQTEAISQLARFELTNSGPFPEVHWTPWMHPAMTYVLWAPQATRGVISNCQGWDNGKCSPYHFASWTKLVHTMKIRYGCWFHLNITIIFDRMISWKKVCTLFINMVTQLSLSQVDFFDIVTI